MKKKLNSFVVIMALVLSLAACGVVPSAEKETPAVEPQVTADVQTHTEDVGQTAPAEIDEQQAEASESSEPAAETGRQDGERYEGVIRLEGMDRTVRYEHIFDSADLFGARFRAMVNTLSVIDR